MDPKAASSRPSDRCRDRTNRRQYHSCDRCRKGRRGCDAVHFGIDPFGRSNLTTSGQNRRRGCSACQKLKKECTFEWLRSIPRQVLPRHLKTQPEASEQRFRDPPGLDASFPPADLSPSRNARNPEISNTGIDIRDGLDLNLGLNGHPLHEDILPLAVDYRLGSILRPISSRQTAAEPIFGATYDIVSPKLFDQSGFSGDQLHGIELTGDVNDPANWVQNNDRMGQTYRDSDHDHDQILETPWADETHPSRQSDLEVPMSTIDGIQATAVVDQNDLLELEHHQNKFQDLFSGWLPTATLPPSHNVDAESLLNGVATQHWPTISMQEYRLADKSNKITISNDLMKIYSDSLENALECWLDTKTCPYRIEKGVGLRSHALNNQTNSPPISNTLYSRVHRLDAAFSGQRRRPLTQAENSGSSKALNLAIMAFACQWSQSPSSSSGLHGTNWAPSDDDHAVEIRSYSDFEASDSHEFERLLRLSVWNESQRCIDRWKYCGSFRGILASIVFFCIQRPLDEDELDNSHGNNPEPLASQDLGLGMFGCFGDQSNSSPPSSSTAKQTFVSNGIANFAPFSSSFYGQEDRLQYLETGIRHLLTWRRLISFHLHKQKGPSHTATETPCNGIVLPGSQYLSDFNLLFWLGIMCDTTSSVLNRRALIIPDTETFTISGVTRLDFGPVTTASVASQWSTDGDHSEGTTQSVDIWSSYLLDADRIRQRSLAAERLSTSQLKSKMIQQAVPLKILFWRKVGKLQRMISQPTSPTEVENAMKESLAVHQYWTINYTEFFTACTREHSNMSFQTQSWYLVLGLGWNMACLILARYIDYFDRNSLSERLGQSLRASSALTSQLKKSSAYAIAELARVSCLPTTSAEASLAGDKSHFALSQSAILSDPHTEKVVKALEIASEILLDWLRQWRNPAEGDGILHLSWLYTNTSSEEISRAYVSCINALDLLKTKSDTARLTTEHLIMQYSRLNGKRDEHSS